VVAGELLDRARREPLTLAELGKREQLLAAAWLASLRSARTRGRTNIGTGTYD
jgi:hypothetical protein